MEEKDSESMESATFLPTGSFNATVQHEANGFITISNGRITGTTLGPDSRDATLKQKFDEIDANDTILTLYVNGVVSENSQGKKTASGDCVFFVSNPNNHQQLDSQVEFKVKKETPFYFRPKGSTVYQRSTFDNFTAVASSSANLDSTSSVQTGHRAAGLFILP